MTVTGVGDDVDQELGEREGEFVDGFEAVRWLGVSAQQIGQLKNFSPTACPTEFYLTNGSAQRYFPNQFLSVGLFRSWMGSDKGAT